MGLDSPITPDLARRAVAFLHDVIRIAAQNENLARRAIHIDPLQ